MEDKTEIIYHYDFRNEQGFYFFAEEQRMFNIELEYLIDKMLQ